MPDLIQQLTAESLQPGFCPLHNRKIIPFAAGMDGRLITLHAPYEVSGKPMHRGFSQCFPVFDGILEKSYYFLPLVTLDLRSSNKGNCL